MWTTCAPSVSVLLRKPLPNASVVEAEEIREKLKLLDLQLCFGPNMPEPNTSHLQVLQLNASQFVLQECVRDYNIFTVSVLKRLMEVPGSLITTYSHASDLATRSHRIQIAEIPSSSRATEPPSPG